MTINEFYNAARAHQKSHRCSAMPYETGNVLTSVVMATNAKTILEVGTGIGYSSVCLALGNRSSRVHTIDKKPEHVELAQKYRAEFEMNEQIVLHTGFAEDIMPTFTNSFDLIFYDGFIPQKKFVEQFYRLLREGGLLITTNLFLGDTSGGRYLTLLHESGWQTGIIGDTAFSVKKKLATP